MDFSQWQKDFRVQYVLSHVKLMLPQYDLWGEKNALFSKRSTSLSDIHPKFDTPVNTQIFSEKASFFYRKIKATLFSISNLLQHKLKFCIKLSICVLLLSVLIKYFLRFRSIFTKNQGHSIFNSNLFMTQLKSCYA